MGSSGEDDGAIGSHFGDHAHSAGWGDGYVDNDAVRMAVARGSSLALRHLGKHGEVNFRYLSQCGIVLKRVDTSDNIADMFTKVLSAMKMAHLLKGILEPEVLPGGRAVVAHRNP